MEIDDIIRHYLKKFNINKWITVVSMKSPVRAGFIEDSNFLQVP